MRVVLIVVAVLALVGFLAVAVVLPMMADAEAREAAQALLAGSEAAKKQVAAAAEKTKSLDGAGAGIKLAPTKNPNAERRDPRLERAERDRDRADADHAKRQGVLALPRLPESGHAGGLRRALIALSVHKIHLRLTSNNDAYYSPTGLDSLDIQEEVQ